MSTAILQKASLLAVKAESTSGTLIAPSAGTDFIPLRPGFSMGVSLEEINTDELLNDIGASKSFAGKETVEGEHPMYFKTKGGTVGYPAYGVLIKSALGAESSRTSTDTVAAGSTAAIINVASGAAYAVGQALLINGEIRNVESIATNALTLNFALTAAPTTGDAISKCYGWKAAASGHPTYSLWHYVGNGGAIQATAGCITTGLTITAPAAQPATIDFSYKGVKYHLNPLVVTASNKFIDVVDFNSDTVSVSVTEGIYRTPEELADEIAAKLTAGTGETFTCTYTSHGANKGKFTIADAAGAFSILWKTGAHGSDLLDTHIGTLIGFSDAADDTASATYTSDNVLTYSTSLTPSYDTGDVIIAKGAELFLGSATDTICRKASNVTVTVENSDFDVDAICATGGVVETLLTGRAVTFEADVLVEQHEVGLFDKFINNTTTKAMLNLGPLTAGDFTTGTALNVCLGNVSITAMPMEGDEVVRFALTGKAFVTTSLKDIYINAV